ncbi:Uncharacterised protein [Bordetella pertussis]|nr:Uncharacterised protein [Bordetella pertussis]
MIRRVPGASRPRARAAPRPRDAPVRMATVSVMRGTSRAGARLTRLA